MRRHGVFTTIFINASAFIRLVPESPRWLISKGKKDEALRIIRRTAKINKTSLKHSDIDVREEQNQAEGTLWHVFASPVLLRRTLILSFNW